jgi:hypothetical protein
MARRRKQSSISRLAADVVPVLRQIGAGQRNVHPEIWARWGSIVGERISSRAIPQALRGKTLVVGVANSAWLQELSYLKATLLDRLAEAVGPAAVREIKLVLDPSIGRASAD